MSALGVEIPRPWPQARVIQAALRGTHREVFKTESGVVVAGVRSLAAWIFLVVNGDGAVAVACDRCATVDGLPEPPPISTAPGAPRGDLFGVETRAYALYALTGTLHPFFRKHQDCKRPEPKPAEPHSQEAPAA